MHKVLPLDLDPPLFLDPLFIGYAAGFIDGEGCFAICTRLHKGCVAPSFEASLVVWQCDPRPLLKLQEVFGGSVHLQVSQRPTCRDAYQWRLNGHALRRLLVILTPYLIVKAEPAALVQQLLENIADRTTGQGRGGVRPQAILQRQELVTRIRAANGNQKGRKKKQTEL